MTQLDLLRVIFSYQKIKYYRFIRCPLVDRGDGHLCACLSNNLAEQFRWVGKHREDRHLVEGMYREHRGGHQVEGREKEHTAPCLSCIGGYS